MSGNPTIRPSEIGSSQSSVVADDNSAFLAKLVSVLATEFEVVATAADGKSALECIRVCQPNVVVLDLEMPRFNGIEVVKDIDQISLGPCRSDLLYRG